MLIIRNEFFLIRWLYVCAACVHTTLYFAKASVVRENVSDHFQGKHNFLNGPKERHKIFYLNSWQLASKYSVTVQQTS